MEITLSPELFIDWAKHELPLGTSLEIMKYANELAEINGADLPFEIVDVNWYALNERLNMTEGERLVSYVVGHFTLVWYTLHVEPYLKREWSASEVNSLNTYIKALKQLSKYRSVELIDLLELDKVKPELLKLLAL